MMKKRLKSLLLILCLIFTAFAVSCNETATPENGFPELPPAGEEGAGGEEDETGDEETGDENAPPIDDESKWSDWGD